MSASVLDERFGWRVVDALPGAVAVLDPDGVFLFTNRAWNALFDYEPGSLVGRSVAVVNAPRGQDPSAVAAEIIAAAHAQHTWHGLIHNVRRSGQEFWSEADVTTVHDPDLGDVLVTMQAELPDPGSSHDRTDELRLFEELARIGTWVYDPERQAVECSAQMFRLHGVAGSPGAVAMHRVLELVHPDDRHVIVGAFDRLRRELDLDKLPQLEYRVVRPDGRSRHMVIRGASIDGPGGAPRRFGGVAIDVTDRYEREQELAQALDREQHTAADLRTADELKDLFLRALSHDLRTPLTIVQGFAETLARHGDTLSSAERQDIAERIGHSAERLHLQLTDLLDLDRLSRGVLTPHRRQVELQPLVADVVEALDMADRTRVRCGPIVAFVDGAQVERIVENLVANAARHAPEATPIEVRCETVDDGILITVEDEGPGVPDALKERVFNVFVKVNPTSKGTGVGLSLVRRFAELHGGRAWVEDRPGGGASFRVLLPTT